MLKVSRLSVNYGNVEALHDVSFEVSRGEIAAIIGANGAGKTTTLNTILRLLPCKHGNISFDGNELTLKKSHEIVRLGIGAVLEGRQLFSDQSVENNLILGGYSYSRNDTKKLRQNVERELDRFPVLRQRRHQLAGTLSGGEQQMLAFARAMMTNPKMLLLDEPTMGLSPVLINDVVATISNLKSKGLTILWVEQMAYAALQISDRAYVIENGRIVKSGSGTQLLNDPHVRQAYLGT